MMSFNALKRPQTLVYKESLHTANRQPGGVQIPPTAGNSSQSEGRLTEEGNEE